MDQSADAGEKPAATILVKARNAERFADANRFLMKPRKISLQGLIDHRATGQYIAASCGMFR